MFGVTTLLGILYHLQYMILQASRKADMEFLLMVFRQWKVLALLHLFQTRFIVVTLSTLWGFG